jgi:NAD(P)-dependent dehydrogenase (short-subunit alcohol dehydrogenase family)
MQMDLNDLESVKAFADKFNQEYNKLDLLLNNAAVMALPERD